MNPTDGGLEALFPEEWRTLEFSVLWTFEAVAAADGKVDQKEEDALHKQLMGWGRFKDPMVQRVWSNVAVRYDSLKAEYHSDPRSITEGLKETLEILAHKVTPESRQAFLNELYTFAEQVAAASGGFLGFGEKTCEKERAVLVELKRTFGL